ncbi:RNA-binding domain-containing protein [Aeromicrobium sp. IC_218]|uniref:AlbA family DNA-binding domain-containing protein n=1 Tax=Aeromicrobium sp. IC_218 TaxID=2545468 RepID=UPI0010389BBA|nr:RNA-binding domain-containing protein [Aeromicrobium sp. IC_218]TCJ00806.1 hypothetical protein E0W78_01630 [Aeromicrobium sp. IC_218]
MIELDALESLLALGHEQRRLEVKGPGLVSDKAFAARVARAVMAMGNLRDGGVVCIGIADDQIAQMMPGLDEAARKSWGDYDTVSAALARYIDPPATFDLRVVELSNGAHVAVLDVHEFETSIYVCKKTFPDVLQDGATYVRTRGKPQSIPVPSAAEMRELLDLGVDKGIREFLRRAGAAGVPLLGTPPPTPSALFDDERTQAWADGSVFDSPSAGTLVDPDRPVCFFDVAIRPLPYERERLQAGDLLEFIERRAVSMRGWPVPFIDARRGIARHDSWIGQDIEGRNVPHLEAWRFFQSGQFLQRRAIATDLRKLDDVESTAPGATGVVAVWDVLLYLVEVAELGARLTTSLDVESIEFEVHLEGVGGRELVSDWRRPIFGPYVASSQAFSTRLTVPAAELVTSPRQAGVNLAQGILQKFGLNVPDQVYLDQQAEIFGP